MNAVPAAVYLLNGRDGEVEDPFPALVAFIFKNADDRKEDAVDADLLTDRCFFLEELFAHLVADISHFSEFAQVVVVDVSAL